MTKYYVEYTQGNNEYVYVTQLEATNVRVTTLIESAISFDDVELAKNLVAVAKTIVANQDYVVLEITTDIKEVK